tara:strand:+ start:8774 stop:9436 length:663 start_codon:yes stop_codon:yes gene_type:complete
MSKRKIHWVARSNDKKVGKVLASYSPIETCPDTCSLKTGGCYAWGLWYLKVLGRKISEEVFKLVSVEEALEKKAKTARIARHRVAGDIVNDVPGTIEECETIARAGLTNIGYTHHWRAEEAQPLKEWFRASCQSMEEVEEARAMGWAVTLIVPDDAKKRTLSNGDIGYLCPARIGVEGKKDINCNSCTLCRVDDKTKDKAVLFKVHGSPSTINKAKDKIE